MSRQFLVNPSFAEYARLLFQLHGMIATEVAESPEADAIREQMDTAWARLSAAERDELQRISEQLYEFHADSSPEVSHS
jgi:vacuolar-type H+-ATPase subunit B/Vma2